MSKIIVGSRWNKGKKEVVIEKIDTNGQFTYIYTDNRAYGKTAFLATHTPIN